MTDAIILNWPAELIPEGRVELTVIERAEVVERRSFDEESHDEESHDDVVGSLLAHTPGLEVLHGRRSRTGLTFAHVAVSPAGVWVVASLEAGGARVTTARRGRELRVGKVPRVDLIEALAARVDVVTELLGEERFWTKVRGVLCLQGASWPTSSRDLVFGSVGVCWPRALPGLLTREGPLATGDIARIVGLLHEALVPE